MAESEIAARVTRYLARQIEWLETGLRLLDHFEEHLEDAALDRFADEQRRREVELGHLAREHQGLLREWREAQDVTEAERANVNRLAERARGLTGQLIARHERAQVLVSQRLAGRDAALGTLERGRELLERYRPGGEESSWMLDKRA
jgi:small-conductance mechanosensitive channel